MAEEILAKIHDETFLYDVLIFCFNKNKYFKLQTQFTKVKMIESMDFDNILQFLNKKPSKSGMKKNSSLGSMGTTVAGTQKYFYMDNSEN